MAGLTVWVGAALAAETVVTAGTDNALTALGNEYSHQGDGIDTLRIKVAQTKNLGGLNLTGCRIKTLIIEPDAALDPQAVVHFSNNLFRFDSVPGRVIIRNLHFRADIASARFVAGNGLDPNGSLELSQVTVSGDSLGETFFGWRGQPADSLVVRRSAFVAGKGQGGEWTVQGIGYLTLEASLWRVPMRLYAAVHKSVTLTQNTAVGLGFALYGLPLGANTGTVRIAGNQFIRNGSAWQEPLYIVQPFGDFDPANQRRNTIHGYGGFVNAPYPPQFSQPGSGNAAWTGSLPDAGELWLWQVPDDTGRGAFAAGGLPNWNVRPAEVEKRFGLSGGDDITLAFAAAEVPRLLNLAYARSTYPASLGYRTRYRADTSLVVTGTIKPTTLRFAAGAGAASAPAGEYLPVLLQGEGFAQAVDGNALSGGGLQFPWTGAASLAQPWVPASKPKVATHPNFVRKGKDLTLKIDGNETVTLTLGEVLRAGYVSASQDAGPNLGADLRNLAVSGVATSALTLGGDVEAATGSKATLRLGLDKATLPYLTDRIELHVKWMGQTSYAKIGACTPESVGDALYAVCAITLPVSAIDPRLAEWRGTFALAERLSIPANASLALDLGSEADVKLNVAAKKGFQRLPATWSQVDYTLPGFAYLDSATPVVRVQLPGRANDTGAVVEVQWNGLSREHRLYSLGADGATKLASQEIGESVLKAKLSDTAFRVFAAVAYEVPRMGSNQAFARNDGFARIEGLTSESPSRIAVSREDSLSLAQGIQDAQDADSSLKGRPLLAGVKITGERLKVASAWRLWLANRKDSTVEKVVYWGLEGQAGQGHAQAGGDTVRQALDFVCKSDTCELPGGKFTRTLKVALLGRKPAPVKPDTQPTDTTPKPTDSVKTDPKTPAYVTQGKPAAVQKADKSWILPLTVPDSVNWASIRQVQVARLVFDTAAWAPTWRAVQTSKPGDTVVLRDSGANDLSYRLDFTDSAGQKVGDPAQGNLPPLWVSMEAKNAAWAAAPKMQRLKRHVLGWSLPDSSRDAALRLWMPGSKAEDRSSDSVEWHALDKDGHWKSVTETTLKQGAGYLVGARHDMRVQFPAQVALTWQPSTLNLVQGWNFIASPYVFAIGESAMNDDLSALDLFQTYAVDSAGRGGWEEATQLEPMKGYAVYAQRALALVFNPAKGAKPSRSAEPAPTAKKAHATGSIALAPPATALGLRLEAPGLGSAALRLTASARGARWLPLPGSASLAAWFTAPLDRAATAYRILPVEGMTRFQTRLHVQMPASGQVSLKSVAETGSAEDVVLLDEQTGSVQPLRSAGQAHPAMLSLPAGTWSFRLVAGPRSEVEREAEAWLSRRRGPEGLALRRPVGGRRGGAGLWQVGVPGALGYRDLGLAAFAADGHCLWQNRLPAPGAGWHATVLPPLPAGAFLHVRALGPGPSVSTALSVGGPE